MLTLALLLLALSKGHCYTFTIVSPPTISSLSPSVSPLPSFVFVTPPFSLPSLSVLPPSAFLPSSPPFLFLTPYVKSPGHQSYVVSGPSEVHSLLHLAQLPLADPEAAGAGAAAAHAGRLPLLPPRLPGQEDAGGLMRW